ncbi:DUF167 domain-containing protein [Chloroflexota bacterium]
MASACRKDNSGQQVKITLRVHPNAARNEITDFTNEVLQIKVAAPPIKGKANKELLTFLSRKLGVSKSDLEIIKGNTSQHKVIAINGLNLEEISKKLLS